MGRQVLMGWVCVLGCLGWAGGAVYFVDDSAVGANNGSSWTDAFVDLQVALDAAVKGDEVRVGQGIYRPTIAGGDRSISFALNEAIVLKGGFAGTGETDPDAWDPKQYKTVLSGDLNGDDAAVGDPATLLTLPSRADNSYHVVTISNWQQTGEVVLDGFIISGGNANGDHYTKTSGGGIEAQSYDLIVQNCIIEFNAAAEFGGGCDGPVRLNNSIVRSNAAERGGGLANPSTVERSWIEGNYAQYGGGIYEPSGDGIFLDCLILDNDAQVGGGIWMSNRQMAMIRCTLEGNRASEQGGGAYIKSDCTCWSELDLYQCQVFDNRAGTEGGGIYHAGNSRLYLWSCLLNANQAGTDGGAVYNSMYPGMQTQGFCQIVNSTMVHNTAGTNGGGIYCESEKLEWFELVNSVLWNNADPSGPSMQNAQIRLVETGPGGGTPPPVDAELNTVQFCCIQGWTGTLGGTGNFGDDPEFVDLDGADNTAGTPDDDLHLKAESPLVNGGINDLYVPVIEPPAAIGGCGTWWDIFEGRCYPQLVDLDGNVRIHNRRVDIGAYEFQGTAEPGTLRVPDDYATIQAAIDAVAEGQTVVVADGVWRGEGNRDITFRGKAITVRSENGPQRCIIDCQGSTVWDQFHRGFVFSSGEGPRSILEGFTITNGTASTGAGILCANESSPTIRGNIIQGNRVPDDWDGGGGISCNSGAAPLIVGNIIRDNVCEPGGGGGGIHCYESGIVRIIGNTILNNTASYGGGIEIAVRGGAAVENNLVAGNHAGFAAGVACWGSEREFTLRNNTIAFNTVEYGVSGVMIQRTELTSMINCIVWGNTSSGGNNQQIGVEEGYADIRYCCIQDWEGGGVGNIRANPLFANAALGDYHLQSQAGRWNPVKRNWVGDPVSSPCIDAGDPAGLIGLEPFPNGGVVNMGAYGGTAEASKSFFGKPVCEAIAAGDINGDCKVDLGDFAIMARHWLESN
jgi:hypothetical protein